MYFLRILELKRIHMQLQNPSNSGAQDTNCGFSEHILTESRDFKGSRSY